MSVNLVPEPVATIAPVVFERPATQRPDTRPVEAGEKSSTGGSEQKRTAERPAIGKDEPNARPPGTDPSVPPQTLFNASLISADFKPSTTSEDIEALSVAAANESETNDEQKIALETEDTGTETSDTSSPASSTPASDRQFDAQRVASYARGSGGSQLTAPATANPDWLSAIEKIA